MKLYFNCQCCNKRNTIAELIMEASWHQGDFQALETFLQLLQGNIKNKEKLTISLDEFENEAKKLPQSLQKKYVPEKERRKPEKEQETEEETDLSSWKTVSLAFTPELVQEWISAGFTYSQTQEWINAGLGVNEANLAAYLREQLLTPEQILNERNLDELRDEFRDTDQD